VRPGGILASRSFSGPFFSHDVTMFSGESLGDYYLLVTASAGEAWRTVRSAPEMLLCVAGNRLEAAHAVELATWLVSPCQTCLANPERRRKPVLVSGLGDVVVLQGSAPDRSRLRSLGAGVVRTTGA
jgi:hypothetical protein